jgi:hypothetical protein
MSKKSDPQDGGFMHRSECAATMSPMQASLTRIETALLGPDLNSGMVMKFNDLGNKLNEIVRVNKLAESEREKRIIKQSAWKLAALSFAGTVVGIVIKIVIDKL